MNQSPENNTVFSPSITDDSCLKKIVDNYAEAGGYRRIEFKTNLMRSHYKCKQLCRIFMEGSVMIRG